MTGGVFISYRRDDSAASAGRVYDRLARRLGAENVFFDVDNIPPGVDFVDVLSERVGKCDALVAVIGRDWTSAAGKDNRRRLDDPNDFVRIEIEAALTRGVRVIPVLVEGAAMPGADELPESLKKLARRQGIEISHNRFESDVERLTRALAMLEDEIRLRDAGEAGREASGEDNRAAEAATPIRDRPKTAPDAAAMGAVRQPHEFPQPRAQMSASPGRRLWPILASVVTAIVLLTGALLLAESRLRSGHVQAVESKTPAAASNLPAAQAALASPSKAIVQPEQTLNAAPSQDKADGAFDRKTSGSTTNATRQSVLELPGFGDSSPALNAAAPNQAAGNAVQETAGDPAATACLAPFLTLAERIRACQPAQKADPTNPRIEFALADALASGGSFREALLMLRQLAESGYAPAQTRLGSLYQDGQGVKQDYAQAMAWYLKAADQGDWLAQSNISQLYMNGWGVKQDFAKATEWLQKAQKGQAQSSKELDRMDEEAKAAIGRIKKN